MKIKEKAKLFHSPNIIKEEVFLSPSFLKSVNVRQVISSCHIPISKIMKPSKYLI